MTFSKAAAGPLESHAAVPIHKSSRKKVAWTRSSDPKSFPIVKDHDMKDKYLTAGSFGRLGTPQIHHTPRQTGRRYSEFIVPQRLKADKTQCEDKVLTARVSEHPGIDRF